MMLNASSQLKSCSLLQEDEYSEAR